MSQIILIFDRDAAARAQTAATLGSAHPTLEASGTAHALEICREMTPGIVLYDPETASQAEHFRSELRKIPEEKRPRIVLCTSRKKIRPSIDDVIILADGPLLINGYCNRWLSKPIDAADVPLIFES